MKITAIMAIMATTAITETGKNVCPCAAVLQDAEKTSDSSEPEVNGINQFEVHLRTGFLFKKAQKYPHLLRDDFENSKIYTTRFTLKQSYIRWF